VPVPKVHSGNMADTDGRDNPPINEYTRVLNSIEGDVAIPQTPDGKHPRAQNQTHDDGNAHHEC
jgi:hypothetical protein